MTTVNLIEVVRLYIDRMIEDCGKNMKAFVMDKETASIASMAYAPSDMLQKEVFLFERIDNTGKGTLKHINAICFLRPTEENFKALVRELHEPRYGNYFLYFTNFVEMNDIKALAEADEYECVRIVQEFYADYIAVNSHLYSLDIPITYEKYAIWDNARLHRTVQGLVSLLLSLRKKSAIIRYQKSSKMAEILAQQLSATLKRQLDFSSSNINEPNPSIVLIIDRREDAVTPLLNKWTYQAMVHELIGIKNNRVNLTQVPGISDDLKEVVMDAEYDEFYANNLYSNFGEIATSIKGLMDHFQEKHKNQSKIQSISDMKTFVESYPEFKKLSGTVSKHVTIVSELSRLVGLYNLFEVSETEQNIACQNNHNEIVQKIKALINEKKVRDEDILRLICLYALRYEHQTNNELDTFKREILRHRRFPEKYIHFFHALLDYGGQKFRQTDLFNTQTTIGITKQFIRRYQDIDNVYTQHVPLIKDLLEQLIRGKLKDTLYPSIISNDQFKQNQRLSINQPNQLQQQGQVIKPSEIIIYVIGGITYEESVHIHIMNSQGARIILGGSYIHNFSSFIDEVLASSSLNTSAKSNVSIPSKRH